MNAVVMNEARRLFLGDCRGNAAAVHRVFEARTIRVSVTTVRRAVRDVRKAATTGSRFEPRSAAWELALVRRIAAHYWTVDGDELESELTARLVKLQARRKGVANWRAYLTVALRRAAVAWVTRERRRHQRESSLDQPLGDDADAPLAVERLAARDPPTYIDPALEQALRHLNSQNRRVVRAVLEENGNVSRAAKRLGVHRNTVTNAMRRVRRVLKEYGCEPG